MMVRHRLGSDKRMRSHPNRRDFVRLAALAPMGLVSPALLKLLSGSASARPNVILLVIDALSALNMPLYGYSRDTSPNISRLANRAVVYHNHFASSNFTSPGTASLLTGTLPWTNRAIRHDNLVVPRFLGQNIFSLFHDYRRLAYTHNSWAFTLLQQFHQSIDQLVPPQRLFLNPIANFGGYLFARDEDVSSIAWARALELADGRAYSLFLSQWMKILTSGERAALAPEFPRGLPSESTGSEEAFLLEAATDWSAASCASGPRPFLAYFHFLPPHEPYNAPLRFCDRFLDDGYQPPAKPVDLFATAPVADVDQSRRFYDEFVLYADEQFGRFYSALESSGLLDNTWLVVTADHGEMFERGLVGHDNLTLYQPLVRVPLLIFEPGRASRLDIHDVTSAIDLLPTLAEVTGHPVPAWSEGAVLPPYNTSALDPQRAVYAVQARENPQYAPLTRASSMLVSGHSKLLYYYGYEDPKVDELVRLYDIAADPEDLVDLTSTQPAMASDMLGRLRSEIARADQPYS